MRRRAEHLEDSHTRFAQWLLDSADDELPRDLAVHAAVCSECRLQIAAFDLLSGVDPSRAGMPPSLRAAPARRRLAVGIRAGIAAASVMLLGAAVAIGAGGLRLPLVGGEPDASPSESPAQAVLGNTGRPQLSTEADASAKPKPTRRPSPTPTPSPTPAPN